MSEYYFESLKQSLEKSETTKEGLESLLVDMQFFLQIAKFKLASNDPQVKQKAVLDIRELKQILEKYAPKFT